MASSISSDHCLHTIFKKMINLLCIDYDVANALENERESDEEQNST